jgi:hypothetical protein
VLLAGLRHAVEQGYDLINMSLSTTKKQFSGLLHDLADNAYFRRSVLVASAHNMPVESYPWKFSSVISVGSHEVDDPMAFFYNPNPPVEFFGRGVSRGCSAVVDRRLEQLHDAAPDRHLSLILLHPELIPYSRACSSDCDERRGGGNDPWTTSQHGGRCRRRRLAKACASSHAITEVSRGSSARWHRRSCCSTETDSLCPRRWRATARKSGMRLLSGRDRW